MGRPVGDQDVGVRGDPRPHLGERRAAVQVEAHVAEPRLPGAAVEAQPADLEGLVLQVGAVLQRGPRGLGLPLEGRVVVPLAVFDHAVEHRVGDGQDVVNRVVEE